MPEIAGIHVCMRPQRFTCEALEKLFAVNKSKGKLLLCINTFIRDVGREKVVELFGALLPDFFQGGDNEYGRHRRENKNHFSNSPFWSCVCINDFFSFSFSPAKKTMKRFFQLWNYFQFSSLLLCFTNEWMYEFERRIQTCCTERKIIVSISLEPFIAFHVSLEFMSWKRLSTILNSRNINCVTSTNSTFLKRHKSVAVYITNDNDFLSLPWYRL